MGLRSGEDWGLRLGSMCKLTDLVDRFCQAVRRDHLVLEHLCRPASRMLQGKFCHRAYLVTLGTSRSSLARRPVVPRKASGIRVAQDFRDVALAFGVVLD